MLKFFSKRLFHSLNESSQKINAQPRAKKGLFQSTGNLLTRIRLRLTPALNYRIRFRNLMPTRYPLTSILIGLNIYNYFKEGKENVYDSWEFFKYKFKKIEKEEIKLKDKFQEFLKMNLALSTPLNEYELCISLATLLLFSRKIEVVFGARYIFFPYLITLAVTSISFLPCNVAHRMNVNPKTSNPNSLNFVFSLIIFMKYRMEYLNSPLLNIAFLSVLVYLLLPEGYSDGHEIRNILLSALMSSALL